uniref:G protein-coupled receptor n=1 Tax=Meloidogyne javanica TaxID=6303 RepID=A0A915MDR7_MELJA
MKTPAPMLVYSKLLMAPCLMDICIATCGFLVQPITIAFHGYFAIMQNGFFRFLPRPYDYTANVFWLQMLLLFVCCTTIQFIFRYYMISSDGHIPTKLKYITGIVLCILLIAHVALHYVSDFPFDEKFEDMAMLAHLVEQEVHITGVRFSSFTYAFCTIGTRRYIAKTCADIGEGLDSVKRGRMREYNQQVTTALLVQAILPTIDVLELAFQTLSPIFFPRNHAIRYMIYTAIPLYFIPVLNPIAAMILVKPYRRAVMNIIGLLKGRVDSMWSAQQPRTSTVGPKTSSNEMVKK